VTAALFAIELSKEPEGKQSELVSTASNLLTLAIE